MSSQRTSQAILRLPTAIALTGRGRSAIYRGIAEGTFPKPIKLGARAIGFLKSEVDDWIDGRIAASRGPSSEPRQ
jgi:prophage regulatory protein